MKVHLIIYTATYNVDYRFVVEPTGPSIPSATLHKFEKSIMGILCDETRISVPKWMLCKEVSEGNSYVLWGVACQNSMLSSIALSDEQKRTIQCFIGFIMEYSDACLKLPYEITAFRHLFEDSVDKKWNSYDKKYGNVQFDIDDLTASVYVFAQSGNALNYNKSNCRFFPSSVSSDEQLFSEALASSKSVSVVTSIERRSEVTNPKFEPLMNAVLLKSSGDVNDVPVKRICKKCKTAAYDLIDGLCENCRSYRTEEDIKQKSLCIECGKEADDLINGLCQECIKNYNKPVCKKCKRQVDVLNKGGICNNCRKEKSLKLLMVVLIAILSIVCLIKCSHSKTHSGIPDWKDAHVLEMTSTRDKTTDTTCITKN